MPHPLTPAARAVLSALRDRAPISSGDLAPIVGRAHSTTHNALTRLEDRGYARRRFAEDGEAGTYSLYVWEPRQPSEKPEPKPECVMPKRARRKPKPSPYAARNAEIVRLHVEEEVPKAELSRRFDLTSERVRQIINEAGVDPEVSAAVAAKNRRRIAARRRADAKARRVVKTCPKCGGEFSHARFVEQTWCSRECAGAARRVWDWSDDDALDYLRRLAQELGHTPSANEIYQDASAPSHTWFYDRFGSIRAAQEAAGLTPNRLNGEPSTACLSRHNAAESLRNLSRSGALSAAEFASALGIHTEAAKKHLRGLVRDGRARCVRMGRPTLYASA